ncbi:hypothetical protein CORC01_05737 [Colletotrichum orchidophilum]|uniref:Uncharacterized protein n=1 Tax=Colletotrichum orchidophilum TaxID=1209926 RepID=A0A1G4BCF4_9PEZI|nr:uncharacterized protein CORC01_05737 [Colletotrichum orchidophilum]OHE99047.1 hypothetical protein CORC01_05737 [Colletotrichum orchidophilum]
MSLLGRYESLARANRNTLDIASPPPPPSLPSLSYLSVCAIFYIHSCRVISRWHAECLALEASYV